MTWEPQLPVEPPDLGPALPCWDTAMYVAGGNFFSPVSGLELPSLGDTSIWEVSFSVPPKATPRQINMLFQLDPFSEFNYMRQSKGFFFFSEKRGQKNHILRG